MQLTLLDVSNVRITYDGQNASLDEIAVLSAEEAASRPDNNHVSKKLISEMLTEIKSRLKMDLRYTIIVRTWVRYSRLKLRCTTPADNILKRLRERFNDEVKVSVLMNVSLPAGLKHPLEVKDLKIDGSDYTCAATGLRWGHDAFDITCDVRIIATIPSENESNMPSLQPTRKPTTPQRILDTGVAYDVVIIAENGAEIKAHKSFLFVWSTTFQNMFQSGMEESQTGRLDMSDLSEAGVWAFLRYLYYDDLEGPKQNVGIAYELLYASHKYEVTELENITLELLMKGTDKEFNAKLAFKIYCFVRNIESAIQLKSKMIGILQMNIDEVKSLPEYKELFQKNPDGAMELCEELVKAARK